MTKGFPVYFALCIKNSMFYVLNGWEIMKYLLKKLYRSIATMKFTEFVDIYNNDEGRRCRTM